MKLCKLKLGLMTALAVIAFTSSVCSAKGTVTATAYLNPSAPKECNFVETEDTQQGCQHNQCNAAVKNAIAALQSVQPNGKCKANAKSRGCDYDNCK
jgi:hypothetical protein